MRPLPPFTLPAAAVFVAALAVRLAWVPTWSRLAFDGHERLYLRAFHGEMPDASTRAMPLALGLYRAVGLLTDDPRALVVLTAAAGALAAAGAAVWTAREFGPTAGVWTGALVAILGEHAAWSTSAYPVVLPHSLLVWAFVAGGWPAAVLAALATSMRPELCLPALLLGRPGLGGLAGPLWLAALGSPDVSDPWLAFRMNLPMVRYLGPWGLALGFLALGDRRTWKLLAAAAWVHLTACLFDDYGARHALLGGVALCALTGVAASRLWGLPGLACALVLALDTGEIARVWLARPPPPGAGLDLGPLPADCVEVSEEPPIAGQALPSHARYFAGEIDDACVVWGEESWHGQWSSRGLRDRARRMRTLYRTEPVAVLRREAGDRVYQRLERR